MADNDINNEEQYKIAASKLIKYFDENKEELRDSYNKKTKKYTFDEIINNQKVEDIYLKFVNSFSLDKLSKFKEKEEDILTKFLFQSGNKNDLCHELEFNTKDLGDIRGGNVYKYGIYKDKSGWILGNSSNNYHLIDEKEAINIGRERIDLLIKGGKLIETYNNILISINNWNHLEEDFKKVNKLKKLSSYVWVKKYYHMLFHDYLSNWFSEKKLDKILKDLEIKPLKTYYGKSHQLSLIYNATGFNPILCGYICASISHIDKDEDEENDNIRYWLYSPGNDAEDWDEQYKIGIIAIGKDAVGDLSVFRSKEEMRKKMQEIINPQKDYSQSANVSWQFANVMKPGDIVYARKGLHKIIGRGEVIGDYEFDITRKHHKNIHKIKWTHTGDWDYPDTQASRLTLTDLTSHGELVKIIEDLFDNKGNNKVNNNSKTITNNLNTILYGPPGTGKTYNTVIEAMRIINPQLITEYENKRKNYDEIKEEFNKQKRDGCIEFITFHQSYAYEEFVEGIKPDLSDEWGNSSENLTYKGTNGVFKKIVLDALYERLEITEEKTKEILNFKEIIDEFCEKYIPDGILETKNKSKFTIIECTDTSIKIIPNNGQDGKIIYLTLKFFEEALKKEEKIENVKEFGKISGVGRSSYYFPIYEELYKIKTQINKNNVPNNGKLDKDDHLVLIKEYYENKIPLKKDINESQKYVLIIDEINRGNISKIFGELITLIEEDKRENLSVRLPYSHEEFTVPKNLYIIGTMNTSDRSIASIDIALRRRFTFKEMMPDSNLVADFGIKFKNIFEELNNRIRILLDRDHQIGHSYFIKYKYKNANIENLKEIWFNCIMPLLNEYFYNDWEKLIALLGEPKKEEGNDNHWSSFIKKIEATTFAIDYEIDKEEQYDFVSDTEIDFEKALNHAFPMKSS